MRRLKLAAMAGGLILAVSPFVRGEPFDAKQVPADAKWMIHVDMDQLQKDKLWDIIDHQLQAKADFVDGITKIETLTGAQFPSGLHDVTIYGSEVGDDAGVVLINADVDKEKLVGFLRLGNSYTSDTYGDHEIHGWQDKGKQLYGAFSAKGLMIVGHSEKNIEGALDVLDGKSESIKPDADAVDGAKAGVVAYAAAKDLPALQQKNPFFAHAKEGWLAISEDGTDLVVHSRVTANSDKSATSLCSILQGIKAFVTLKSTADDADNNVKNAAAAMTNLTATAKDDTVKVEGKVSEDLVRKVIEERAAATQPEN